MIIKFKLLIVALIFLKQQDLCSGIISACVACSTRKHQQLQTRQQLRKSSRKYNRKSYKTTFKAFHNVTKGIVSQLDELQTFLKTENWSGEQISMLLDNVINTPDRKKIRFLRENGYSYESLDNLVSLLHRCEYEALYTLLPEFSNYCKSKKKYKLFAKKLVDLDLINFRYKTSIFKNGSACERAVENGDLQTTQFLLEHGDHANANEKILIKSKNPKITRLLMLYGAPIPEPIQYQKELSVHVWPAISIAMKAAALGNISEFENLIRSKKNKQAILNSALRYAATNFQIAMVKYLLENEANPYAKCPDVVKEVKTTFKLIKTLRNREDIDSNKYKLYDYMLNMFTSDKSLDFFIRKHRAILKGIEFRIRPELIPSILIQIFSELTPEICNKIYIRYAEGDL